MLSFTIQGMQQDPPSNGVPGGSVTGKIGATMAWVPAEHGGPGLFLALHGSGEVAAPLSDDWRLKVKFASTGAVDFLIWDDVTVNGPSDASASATIETTRKTETGALHPLGCAGHPSRDRQGHDRGPTRREWGFDQGGRQEEHARAECQRWRCVCRTGDPGP